MDADAYTAAMDEDTTPAVAVAVAVANDGGVDGLDPAMEVNRPPTWMTYRAIMLRFMIFTTTSRSYDTTKICSDNELAFRTPLGMSIGLWLCMPMVE